MIIPRITEIEKKIPGSNTFMKEAAKNIFTKTEVNSALNLGGKYEEKENFKHFIQLILLGKAILKVIEPKIIYYSNQFFGILKQRLIIEVLGWKSKGLSQEIIKPPNTSDNSLAPSLKYIHTKIRLKFNGSYLKQDKQLSVIKL